MKQRALVLAAIQMIENADQNYRDVNADAGANFDARTGARKARELAEFEFSWQWRNVKALLELPDRLEKWLNSNSEMRCVEILEGQNLRWCVRLKEVVFVEPGEREVAHFEAGTYEEALDKALTIAEADGVK